MQGGQQGNLFSFNSQLSVFVNLSAMTNCQNQDNHIFVLDITQHPIVSNPVSPEAGVITF